MQIALSPTLRSLHAQLLRTFVRIAPTERHRLFGLTILIGGACGLVAVAFHSAIRFAEHLLIDRALVANGRSWMVWTVLTPTLGALLCGVLLQYVVPQARGSGIPQIKFIYAVKSGRLRLRDAVGKFFVAALQIGSGSSLGREGPTVQICASVASALGRMLAISPQNLRRLIPVGAAAGIAAAFNAPIAAVTFTIEEIVGDLDQTLLSGVVVAAALAAVIERTVLGEHPMFDVPGQYGLSHASSLLVYALLGFAAALLSQLFYVMLFRTRAWFRSQQGISPWARPALGGLGTGIIAVIVMLSIGASGVTVDGHATLSAALVGNLSLRVMLTLALVKVVVTVLCYSSGGAGGIFAPVLFAGAMLGGSFGYLDRFVLGHVDTELGAFALVGMGAFFAAVIRAPITSVLIIFEMTRSYGLVLPLMIANSAAYVLAHRLHPVAIYEGLLEQDGRPLPHTQRAATALSSFHVGDAMTTELFTLSAQASLQEAVAAIADRKFSMFPVIDKQYRLVGLISEARLRRRSATDDSGTLSMESLARPDEYLRSDQTLSEAVVKMRQRGARQMAVVSPDNPSQLVGVLAMSDIMRAHALAASPPPELRDDDGRNADKIVVARRAVTWPDRDTERDSLSIPPEKARKPTPASGNS